MVLCPNAIVNVLNEMNRQRKIFNFGTLKRLVLLLNIGRRNGQTFIGSARNPGNHWVLVVVELRPFKRVIYCDSLAFDPPANILEVVNSFTNHIRGVGSYDSSLFSLAHSPLATSPGLGHVCDWRCRNYPLQTCSDVCGVIALINAALAALDRPLFQYLIGPYEKEAIYLKRPTQHSKYLRRVLMSWFAEGRIDIDYVLLQPGWRDNVPSNSDHTFCLRQDKSANSKKKFKLSLNRKECSSSRLTPETAEDGSPSDKCSAPPTCSARSASNAQTCVPGTDQSSNASNLPPTDPVSPKATQSPLLEKYPSAVKSQSSSKRNSSLSRKRPLFETSTLSKKSRKFVGSSGECPSTAKQTRPSTPTDLSPSQNAKSNSTLTPKPTNKALSSTASSSRTNNESRDQPCPTDAEPQNAAETCDSPEIRIVNESSCDTGPAPKVVNQFQCEDCGLQLSSRNCLYKHKKRKHNKTRGDSKPNGSKHVICPECTGKQSRLEKITIISLPFCEEEKLKKRGQN